jgi:chromate transporter
MSGWEYFWLFLKASLFSSGGTGNLPSLHNDLTAAGVATNRQFTEALLIGQLSPGPTGLWSIGLGFLTRGLFGSIAALIAVTLPPLLVLLVDRLYRRVERHPAVEGFVRGLGLAIVGVYLVILLRLLAGSGHIDLRTLLIAVGAAGLGTRKRIPVPAILALAALVGIALYRF